MTVEEYIEAYTSLSDKVFEKQRHRVAIKGKIQGEVRHRSTGAGR
jgi:hypothetical protein